VRLVALLRPAYQFHQDALTLQSTSHVCAAADMDGTLTVPVIDFAMMRKRVGVPPEVDILTEVNSWPHERRVRGHQAIAEVEDQVCAPILHHNKEHVDVLHSRIDAVAGPKLCLLAP